MPKEMFLSNVTSTSAQLSRLVDLEIVRGDWQLLKAAHPLKLAAVLYKGQAGSNVHSAWPYREWLLMLYLIRSGAVLSPT
jgi:hypothetical protein